MRLCEISPFLVEKYKARRRERVKPATVNREIALLKHMLNTAVRWGRVKDNAARGVKKLKEDNRRERILSPEEIRRLLDCSEGHKCKHLRPILVVALNTGMRMGEILSLRWDDVDLGRGNIRVVNSKNGRMRKIPMSALLAETLRTLKVRSASAYVFAGSSGFPYGSVKRSFSTALKKAGIRDFRFHDLRHTAATYMVMGGADIATVKEILGHSAVDMTMRYSHPTPQAKRSAVEVLNGVMKTDGHNLVTISQNG